MNEGIGVENINLMVKKKNKHVLLGNKIRISIETYKLAKQCFDTYAQINVSLYSNA